MTHLQASDVARYLNRIYNGPNGSCAFVEKRTVQTDSNGFWVYYITSPNGAFYDHRLLSLLDENRVITKAMEVLGYV